MLSNDVTRPAPCRALLLTPKARVIAPLVVVRRGDDDFLLLTEPGLGETVRVDPAARALRGQGRDRAGGAHVGRSSSASDGRDSERRVRRGRRPSCSTPTSSRPSSARSSSGCASRRAAPAWGKELDDSILPAEAGLDETHISFTKGCYPGPGADRAAALPRQGQPRAARARGRGRRSPGDEIRVGRQGRRPRDERRPGNRALGYVRVEVPDGRRARGREPIGKPRWTRTA